MSRYNTRKEDGSAVSYGYDHVCGYFYMEFAPENDDWPVVDVDTMFDGLTGVQLAERIKGIAVREDHVQFAMMDLQF